VQDSLNLKTIGFWTFGLACSWLALAAVFSGGSTGVALMLILGAGGVLWWKGHEAAPEMPTVTTIDDVLARAATEAAPEPEPVTVAVVADRPATLAEALGAPLEDAELSGLLATTDDVR